MRRALTVAAAAMAAVACGGGGGSSSKVHTYHAAASVGDFLTLTVNHDTHEIDYVNITNGDTGTVGFTDRSDGGMDVTDPNGDLVQCYELPGQAIVCQGEKLGSSPTHADHEPALMYGVLDQAIAIDDLASTEAGYLQFRTREGGIELGHVSFDADSNGTGTGYYPVNLVFPDDSWYGKPMYATSLMSSTDMVNNSTYGCVDWTEPHPGGDTSHIFGTVGGDFMADSANGALFAFRDAASKDFDPTNAGTYTALVYHKEVSYVDGTETATGGPTISTVTLTVSAAGLVTVTPSSFSAATLQPFEDSPWQDTGKVENPVHGLFYFTNDDSGSPVYVTFYQGALAFAEFDPIDMGVNGAPKTPAQYSYTYGIAVKVP